MVLVKNLLVFVEKVLTFVCCFVELFFCELIDVLTVEKIDLDVLNVVVVLLLFEVVVVSFLVVALLVEDVLLQ